MPHATTDYLSTVARTKSRVMAERWRLMIRRLRWWTEDEGTRTSQAFFCPIREEKGAQQAHSHSLSATPSQTRTYSSRRVHWPQGNVHGFLQMEENSGNNCEGGFKKDREVRKTCSQGTLPIIFFVILTSRFLSSFIKRCVELNSVWMFRWCFYLVWFQEFHRPTCLVQRFEDISGSPCRSFCLAV